MALSRKRTIKPYTSLSTSDKVRIAAILQYYAKQGKIVTATPPVIRQKKGSR